MRARWFTLLVPALIGCPKPVALRPYPAPPPLELLAQARQSQQRVQSIKLYGKADVPDDKGGRVKLDIAVAVQRPAKLRLSAESMLAGPILTLATDGQSYQLLDPQNNRYLSSVVTPCAMARLLRVALPPTVLADVLTGGAPILTGDDLTLDSAWDSQDGGREVLKLADGQGRRQVLFLQAVPGPQALPGAAPPKLFDLVQSELVGSDGKPFLRIRHQRFANTEAEPALRLPKQSQIEDLVGKSEVKLRWKESEVNPALPAELFSLPQPPGIPSDPDPCVGQSSTLSP